MKKALVSIIIPTFNRAHIICEALDSVLELSYDHWECIVVDDGSTDDTIKVVQQYVEKDSRFKVYNRPESLMKGPSSARNHGVSKAQGKYVIFLDSDDLLIRDCLTNRIKFAEENEVFDLWIFKMNLVNTASKSDEDTVVIGGMDYDKEQCLSLFFKFENPFTVTNPLWRRTYFQLLGGFDENLIRLEDPDLHCRALLNGARLKFDIEGDPDCVYRYTDNKDHQVLKVELDAYWHFINKYLQLINVAGHEKWCKLAMYSFLKRKVFTPNAKSVEVKRFFKLLDNHKLFRTKELFYLRVLKTYVVFGLNRKKGLGFYRISKWVFNKIGAAL